MRGPSPGEDLVRQRDYENVGPAFRRQISRVVHEGLDQAGQRLLAGQRGRKLVARNRARRQVGKLQSRPEDLSGHPGNEGRRVVSFVSWDATPFLQSSSQSRTRSTVAVVPTTPKRIGVGIVGLPLSKTPNEVSPARMSTWLLF